MPKRYSASSARLPKKRYAICQLALLPTASYFAASHILTPIQELREDGLVSSQGTLALFETTTTILCNIECANQWNTPSIDFYEKKLKATKMDDWVGMRLEEEGIEALTK